MIIYVSCRKKTVRIYRFYAVGRIEKHLENLIV